MVYTHGCELIESQGVAVYICALEHGVKKVHTKYVCQACAYESTRWLGKCPACEEWNTFVEEALRVRRPGHALTATKQSVPVSITEISVSDEPRFSSRIPELDRVLGGGIVPGSVVLVGGDPGIG